MSSAPSRSGTGRARHGGDRPSTTRSYVPGISQASSTSSLTACEPHSLMVTTRAFGNAGRPAPPGPLPEYPNAAAFSAVSGASRSNPSTAISRRPARNAPRVSSPATGTATWAKSCLSGSYPSRCRAWVILPEVGTLHAASQHPHSASVPASRAATSSPPPPRQRTVSGSQPRYDGQLEFQLRQCQLADLDHRRRRQILPPVCSLPRRERSRGLVDVGDVDPLLHHIGHGRIEVGQRLGHVAVGEFHLFSHRVGNVQALADAHCARDINGVACLGGLRASEHLLLALERLEDLPSHRPAPLVDLPSSEVTPVFPGLSGGARVVP